MTGSEISNVPEITLLKSEIEAAAARVAERAMNNTVDGVSAFIGDAFGGWIGDGVKQWRTRRLEALAKTKDHLEKHGVSIERAKPIPMGELLQIFEGASKTEDLDLTEMWAALLSNSMNPDRENFVDPSFARILQNLSGLDARILSYNLSFKKLSQDHRSAIQPLHDQINYNAKGEDPNNRLLQNKLREMEEIYKGKAQALIDDVSKSYSDQNISYSISNLIRLGLLYVPEIFLGHNDLIKLKSDHYGEEIKLDDAPLRRELESIRRRFDITAEKNNELHVMSEKARLMGNLPVPKYALTGLGLRFLEACS